MDPHKGDKQNPDQDGDRHDKLSDSLSGEFPEECMENDSLASSGGSEGLEKRQRIDSPSPSRQAAGSPFANLMVAASPPKFISLEQIMQAADGVQNMALAHEIAVDNDFSLSKLEPPEDSIEKKVKEIMHRAFWDVLAEKLREDPPDYSHALILLQEVKETLLDILLPQHQRLRSQIEEVLDLELIEQKADHGALDFHYYASFVISIMARLCAPARDEAIAALNDIKDIVPLYKEMFAILDLMKMDMANFTIQQIRPYIQQQSVEYERKKFQDFLRVQEENNLDGLEITKQWLTAVYNRLDKEVQANTPQQSSVAGRPLSATPASIMNEAYMELLDWDDRRIFPETIVIDEGRFLDLRDKIRRLTLISAVLLVTYNTVGGAIAGIKGFKQKLKTDTEIIIEDTPVSGLKDVMVNVADHIIKEVQQCLVQHGFQSMDESRQNLLKGQIKDVVDNDHPVHKIIKSRVHGFVRQLLSTFNKSDVKLPPGLTAVSDDLNQVCGSFLKLISHNRNVFGIYYADIIGALVKAKTLNDSPMQESAGVSGEAS